MPTPVDDLLPGWTEFSQEIRDFQEWKEKDWTIYSYRWEVALWANHNGSVKVVHTTKGLLYDGESFTDANRIYKSACEVKP